MTVMSCQETRISMSCHVMSSKDGRQRRDVIRSIFEAGRGSSREARYLDHFCHLETPAPMASASYLPFNRTGTKTMMPVARWLWMEDRCFRGKHELHLLQTSKTALTTITTSRSRVTHNSPTSYNQHAAHYQQQQAQYPPAPPPLSIAQSMACHGQSNTNVGAVVVVGPPPLMNAFPLQSPARTTVPDPQQHIVQQPARPPPPS
ncbi:hypothetical protein SCHPADRAFT_569536 [Schizopora paradoxa]|uniref:Uncharacterized protein n=1 Tax=Schizopora paradoxa TaxID=27342 RepID=A0A0H2RBU7_9AGAM|nr:hypothetical protein SCHPADRAFT_569536 [Schizopora paradoxa]